MMIYKILWIIENGIIFLIFFLSLFILGDFVFQKMKLKEISKGGRIVLSTGLGIDLFYFIIFTLSLLKLFYIEVVIGVVVVFFFIFHKVLLESLRFLKDVLKENKKIFLLLPFLLPFFITPFYPPISSRGFDATWYHFPLAMEYIRGHSFYVYNRDIMCSTYPQFTELLFAFLLKTGGWLFTHLFEFICFFLSAIVVKEMGGLFSKEMGVIAGMIAFGNPYALYIAGTGYVEGGLVLFCALSCFSFLLFYETGDKKLVILTGLFSGSAGAIKYTGLLYLPWFAIGIFIFSKKDRFKNLILFSLSALLFPFPYLLRNFVYVGNPVHPFFAKSNGFFIPVQSGKFSFFPSDIFFPFIPYHGFITQKYGPYEFHTCHLYFHYFIYLVFSPFFVFLFPLFREKKFRELFLFFSLFSIFYIGIWVAFAPTIRFTFPIIPQNSFLISLVTIKIFSFLRRSNKFLWIIFVILLTFPAWWFLYKFKKQHPEFPHPDFRAPYSYIFLNTIANEEDILYTAADENLRSFYKGKIFVEDYWGKASVLSNPEKMYEILRSLNVKYFLIPPRLGGDLLRLADIYFHNKKFLIIYDEPHRILFKVLPDEREEYEFSENLLLNPSFKELKDGKPDFWRIWNFELISEGNSVLLPPKSSAYQMLPVSEKGLYEVSHCTRTREGKSSARLQINWYKRENKKTKLIRADIRVVPVSVKRECNSMYALSPPDAERMDFYLFTQGEKDVIFDSPSLRYIRNYEELLSKYGVPYPYSITPVLKTPISSPIPAPEEIFSFLSEKVSFVWKILRYRHFVNIKSDLQLFGEWHKLEGKKGGYYRWTGKKFGFYLDNSKGYDKLLIKGYSVVDKVKDGFLEMNLYINEKFVFKHRFERNDEFMLEIPLPPDIKKEKILKVEAELDKTFRSPPDVRELGIVINSIGLKK